MAYDVEAVLKANVTQFSSGIKEAESMFDSLLNKSNSTMDKLASGISVAGKAMTGIGLGATAIGISAAKGFGEFQMNLNKAAVVAGGTSKNINELADVANRMGAELPISANEAAQAMIEMAQNGADLDKIKTQFPAIAQAATAAGADLTTTAGVVQQAMNVWGDSIGSSEQAAAILTQNANISNASIETMQQGLSNVASSSKLLGVNMTDASAAIGLITNTGMSAAQASQDLNHAMLKMAAPSKNGVKAMKRLGLSFTDAAGNMKPFKQILTEVADKTKDMSQAEKTETLKNLFDTSGMQAINPLLDAVMNKTGDATQSWEAAINALTGVSGSQADAAKFLAESANEMQQNMGSKIEQVGGNWEALTNTAMAAKGGVTSSLLDMTNNTLSWAASSDSAVAKWTRSFIGLSPVIGPIMTTVGTAMMNVNNIAKGLGGAFNGLKTVMSNPFALAVVAIAALVASLVYAYQHSEKFRNVVNKAVDTVVKKFNELKAQAQPAIDAIKQAFSKFDIAAFAPLIATTGTLMASLGMFNKFKLKNPFAGLKFTMPKLKNPFSGLANKAKSAGAAVKGTFSGIGNAIKSAFSGVGNMISTVFKGIASAIGSLNFQGVAAFAVGLAAVTAALVALSATQGMVLPFLQGLAQIFVQLVGGVLQGLASALVTLAPVMTTLASALAMLSPLVVAFGTAFSMAATAVGGAIAQIVTSLAGGVAQITTAITPIVAIISTTFVQVVTVISQAIVQIVQAIAPFVPVITTMFTTITTVIANAIVQIVQALAPFIPAVTEMVTALAPVLSQIVQAFSNLVSQISPIIDSIGNLFKSLGTAIETVLSGASNVITSFGNSIRTVLDGVAGIFESMGNSAKNAGTGVKLMAQGISTLTGLPLGDMAATLAAVASGLAAIVASGIGFAGAGLQAAGTGLMLIATAGMQAQVALTTLPSVITSFTASLTGIGGALTTAGAAITNFAAGAVASLAGLSGASAQIASFTAMVVTIVGAVGIANAGLASFNGQANAAGAALGVLGGRATAASSQIIALGTGIMSAMANATTAIASAGTQMTVTMQSAMNQVVNVVRNGMTNAAAAVRNGASQMATAMRSAGTQMVAAAQSMVNQTVSAVRNGRGAMQSAGYYMAQGLAVGMRSALPEVTAAANQLVAQAEKAAQAKAKIHSPSRLFRDEVGWFIGAGVAAGIDKSAARVAKSVDFIKDLASPLASDILNAGDFAMSDMQASLSTTTAVNHAPQTISYVNDNTASQNNLMAKMDELISYVKDGNRIYMDGKEVGRTVDRHLGQSTQLRSRTSWA
ncbi:phage tail tape measure protein [Streptococcus lutetiensis]|uniref:phage tail tape measure protein n=1 Tax=Streptococcus lutetiensis TaxID=150055 RepID=UPI000FE1E951|nr:phage tail tape measure protein [Streptococcus lutetiensis]RHB84884.1 phage tail tape measure protein [Streptococcus lutetiensis]